MIHYSDNCTLIIYYFLRVPYEILIKDESTIEYKVASDTEMKDSGEPLWVPRKRFNSIAKLIPFTKLTFLLGTGTGKYIGSDNIWNEY